MVTLDFDRQFKDGSVRILCGTDEAGRGPLAGPVVAAACILPDGFLPEGLDDSKKLTKKRRDTLYDIITENAVAWCAASCSAEEIDEINILEASLLAMRRAIAGLGITPDLVLVDGNIDRGFPMKAQAVIGGDALSPSIAAASIIAKVTRDRLCADYEMLYPQYGFAKHKGYPTPAHKLAVFEHGPCPIHRKSFLTFLTRDREKLEAALRKKQATSEK